MTGANVTQVTINFSPEEETMINIFAVAEGIYSIPSSIYIKDDLSPVVTTVCQATLSFSKEYIGREIQFETTTGNPDLPAGCSPLCKVYDLNVAGQIDEPVRFSAPLNNSQTGTPVFLRLGDNDKWKALETLTENGSAYVDLRSFSIYTLADSTENNDPAVEISDQSINEGNTLSFNLDDYADDSDGDTLSFQKVSGVGSLTGNTYSWTTDYDDAGFYVVTILVSDGRGGVVSDVFSITVTGVNAPPEFTSLSPANGSTVPQNTDLTWDADDLDGDLLTYNLHFGTSMSAPRVLSETTAEIYSPVLIKGQTYYWKVEASDGNTGGTVSTGWMSFGVESETFADGSLSIVDDILLASGEQWIIIHAKGLSGIAGIEVTVSFDPEYLTIDGSKASSVELLNSIADFMKLNKNSGTARVTFGGASMEAVDIADEDVMRIKVIPVGRRGLTTVNFDVATTVGDIDGNLIPVDITDTGLFWIE